MRSIPDAIDPGCVCWSAPPVESGQNPHIHFAGHWNSTLNLAEPELLSTQDFHSAVHALKPSVAVFDCDGTLWSGDAGSSFMRWTVDNRILAQSAIDWLAERYRGYQQGQVSEAAICGEMLQVYQGLPESRMREAAAEFFRTHIEPHIFPEMVELVEALQANGTEIWAVSSTNDWVIEEGVTRFGIPANRVLSARVAIADGLVTANVLDVPTDQGKVSALARVGITAPDAVFGNSVHDAAMLAIARRAFPVNPTPALTERSAREGWPVYYPASVRTL
jgi:phosphoserine phosphatase